MCFVSLKLLDIHIRDIQHFYISRTSTPRTITPRSISIYASQIILYIKSSFIETWNIICMRSISLSWIVNRKLIIKSCIISRNNLYGSTIPFIWAIDSKVYFKWSKRWSSIIDCHITIWCFQQTLSTTSITILCSSVITLLSSIISTWNSIIIIIRKTGTCRWSWAIKISISTRIFVRFTRDSVSIFFTFP